MFFENLGLCHLLSGLKLFEVGQQYYYSGLAGFYEGAVRVAKGLSVCLSACLPTCLSVCLSVYVYVYAYMYVYVYGYVYVYV